MRRRWLWAFCVAWASADARGQTLVASWNDGHGLVPFDGQVREEIEAILGEAGVHVAWVDPQSKPRVSVIVSPSDPSGPGWNLSSSAMGVYLVGPGSTPVFVFYRRVVDVVGLSSSSAILPPEKRKLLAKAIARVAVHELVHRMTPARPHASSGIMQERLGGALLAREHLRLDEESTAELVSALREGPAFADVTARPRRSSESGGGRLQLSSGPRPK